MLPVFLVEETTVRAAGESPAFDCAPHEDKTLIVTLGITHAVERESIDVEIHGSADGFNWSDKPLLTFTPKYYCGTYEMSVTSPPRYLRAAWRVNRWGGGDRRPYFRFYLFGAPARERAMAGAA